MAPNDDPKRARPQAGQASTQSQAARNKRKRAAAVEEGGSSGDERSRGGKAAKVAASAGAAGGASRGGPATVSAVASGSKQVVPTPEEERITKLDFSAFPSSSLRAYILANGLMPRLEPSPYSDDPAPLPETLYKDPNTAPVPQPGEEYPPQKRVAILADVQAAHEVLSKHAKEHWHKTQGNGPREGEVVTGFLYACKVGDRVLKIVPPSN